VEDIASRARRSGARVVLLDLSHSPYADSDGLRWLLKLQRASDQEGFVLRIVVAKGSRVRRNLVLLGAGLDLYSDAQVAWYGRSHFEHELTPDPTFGQHPPLPVAVRA
jgi:anti-anti-sigma regulatory factor